MRRPRVLPGVFVSFALLLAACSESTDGGAPTPSGDRDPTPALRTIDVDLGDARIMVEVADDPDERVQGLSGRDALPPGAGMLFVWDEDSAHHLWMKGMRFALDFVWLDAAKTVIEIHRDVPAQPGVPDADLVRYAPSRPSRYVIELNAGDAARLGIEPGDVLEFDEDGD